MIKHSKNSGFAILTTIFIMVVFAVLGSAAISLVTGSAQMMVNELYTQQAFDVAQAGLNFTARQLTDDGDWSDNAGTTMNLGSGSFTTTYAARTADTATVQSTGTVEGVSRIVRQSFEAGPASAFTKAIYSEDEIVVGGSSTGDVFGEVQAGGDVDEAGGVAFHDTVEENNSETNAPTPNWTYWEGVADHTVAGNHTFAAGAYSGIYYVTGSVNFQSNVTLNGTVICRDKVNINGSSNVTIIAGASNPAIFAENDIWVNGSSGLSISGWILSLTDVSFTGNTGASVTGGITAHDDVIFSGDSNTTVTYDESLAPSSVTVVGGERSGVVLTDWMESY